jgi:hypothetical protein
VSMDRAGLGPLQHYDWVEASLTLDKTHYQLQKARESMSV